MMIILKHNENIQIGVVIVKMRHKWNLCMPCLTRHWLHCDKPCQFIWES